jgi:hypothetical protein
MLHSRHVVRARCGGVLGIFSAPLADHAAPIRAIVAAHPGAKVESIVTTDSPCPDHPAFEADNCPSCSPT